jgi:enoyl-CoA hydratase
VTTRFEHLRLTRREGVATLTLDRPPVNAVDRAAIEGYLTAVTQLAEDPEVRAVVLAGAGRGFCAGADVAMMRELTPANYRRARRWLLVQERLESMAKPVIAAVHGYALGGGAELALACDVRLMAEGAVLGFPEIELGIFPGAGGTQRLTRLVGPARALRLMMDGRRLGAADAHALGLVDEVVPDGELLPRAEAYAAELAAKATRAIGLLKRCVYGGAGRPLAQGLRLEAQAVMELIRTEDAREGLGAFLAKRRPRFTGR